MIIPGILEKDWNSIRDKIETVYNRSLSSVDLSSQNIIYREKIKKIQIDFCDGLYVKSQTWSPLDVLYITEENKSNNNFREINNILEKGLPYWESFDYEADLMVDGLRVDSNGDSNISKYIEAVAMLGFSHVVLHADNVSVLVKSILKAKEYMLSVAISSRDINVIKDILLNDINIVNHIDCIQIMGIENIGFQCQPLSDDIVEKIKSIREILNNLIINEDTKIRVQIDGAMSNDTIQICKDARADDFVMGSAYFNK